MNYFNYMSRKAGIIELTDEERIELKRRASSSTTSKRDHIRALIILNRSEGIRQHDIAKKLNLSIGSVNKWSQRFEHDGIEGLVDKKGRGRKDSISLEKIKTVIDQSTQPKKPLKRWSTRKMAAHAGISHTTVHRIWKKNELKPHLTRTFKVSNDPHFVSKFWDVIGLYLNPPEKALVLCCDEKSQCQALERTQPSLPLGMEGYVKTATHDYIRHGTITLFAALNYLDGKIISRTEEKHSHIEWLRFLKQIKREIDEEMEVHIIADNYSTHKHEKVKAWFKRNPRFKLHFTPTGSSWLNLVERFFRDISEECIRHGSFSSVKDLVNDIADYLDQWNLSPRKYQWKAEGKEILAKINKAREKLGKAIYSF